MPRYICFNPECRRDVKSKRISYCDEYLCNKCWSKVRLHIRENFYSAKRNRRYDEKWFIRTGKHYYDDFSMAKNEALVWAKICREVGIKPEFPAGLSTTFPQIFPGFRMKVEEIVN